MPVSLRKINRFIESYLWVTQNYEILFIPKMETSHLRNTVRMLLRKYVRLGYEMRSVLEHPWDIQDVDEFLNPFCEPSYRKMLTMLKVLKRRGNDNREFEYYLDGYRSAVRGEQW